MNNKSWPCAFTWKQFDKKMETSIAVTDMKKIQKLSKTQLSKLFLNCSAKAKVVKRYDGSFFLYSCDDHHNHLANIADMVQE